MALSRKTEESLLERGYSRRQIARISLGAAAAIPFFTEFAQAQQMARATAVGAARPGGRVYDPEAVVISNPLRPTSAPSPRT